MHIENRIDYIEIPVTDPPDGGFILSTQLELNMRSGRWPKRKIIEGESDGRTS